MGPGPMLIAATLSLAVAFAARRFGVTPVQIRAVAADPRWIGAAVLVALALAAGLVLLLR